MTGPWDTSGEQGGGGQAPPPPPAAPGYPPPGYPQPGYPPHGYPYPGGYGYPVQRPTNPQATWALVLGIVSLTMCWFITGIPAIILGHKARKEIAQSGGTQDGDGFALAGLIMGWASTVLSLLGIAFYAAMILFVVAVGESSESQFEQVGTEIESDYYDEYCNDEDQYTYNDC